MTNHPENLVAWLDDELPVEEAAAVTLHVESCVDCRRRAHAYSAVSDGLMEYRTTPKRRWVPIAAVAAGIAAALLLTIALWPKAQRTEITHIELHVPEPARPVFVEAPPRRNVARRVVKRRPLPVATPPIAQAAIYESVVRVEIPADELFAPGTVPPGFKIFADLTLAADGTPRELRVLP